MIAVTVLAGVESGDLPGDLDVRVASSALFGVGLVVAVDCFLLRRRVTRLTAAKFGDKAAGVGGYAIMRSLQMKFMRLPKAQVKIGQRLPEHYR